MMKNHVRLPAYITPERYRIRLKPDLNEFTFTGEEAIDLFLEKPTKHIILHSIELEIESAEFIHENNETWAAKTSYDKESETVAFTFPRQIQKGKGRLKLIFKGLLNDKMRGFYRSRYLLNGKEKHLATTQFESTDARRAFPCFDEPAKKAIFDVSLVVPKDKTVISNTIESNISEHESGYKIVEFAPTPKMSTYLLAFIVGDFEYIEKVRGRGRVRVFTTPGKKKQAQFALDVATKCMDFYEDYFGLKFPLPVLDMIAIPDFAAGAMENWGAVTYRESALLVDEKVSSTANKQWVAMVIAHELAHQWFGDLVTMKWWTHLWLNEGFASFIEYLAIDHIFPRWHIWTQFVSSELTDAFALDSLKNTHPIEVKVGHPAEISEIFDKVSYSKGASVLRMLWKHLGDEDFKNGLRHYLKKHSFSNADTEDLWESLEKVSGKPVRKIMKNWTSKAGHPILNVKFKMEKTKLELTQSRFFISPISRSESKDETVWSIPLGQEFLMDKRKIVIPANGEKINQGEVSLARVNYPENYLKGIEKLPAVDKLGLVRDAFDLAQADNRSTIDALELARNFINEEDYIVWSELTGKISKLDSLLAMEPYYENFREFSRNLYKSIASKLGWQKKKGEQHTDSLLRGIVLYQLGTFGDKETIAKARQLFQRADSIDSDLRTVVYSITAQNGGSSEFSTLLNRYKKEENQQEKDRIGRSLGQFKSTKLLKQTLEFALSKDVRFQSSLGIIASVWHNPKGRHLAWEFVKKNWKLLKERYAGGHYFTRVFVPAGDFTTVKDAKDIEKFIKENPAPEARRTTAQVLEQIYSNAAWLARDRKNMVNFFSYYAAA